MLEPRLATTCSSARSLMIAVIPVWFCGAAGALTDGGGTGAIVIRVLLRRVSFALWRLLAVLRTDVAQKVAFLAVLAAVVLYLVLNPELYCFSTQAGPAGAEYQSERIGTWEQVFGIRVFSVLLPFQQSAPLPCAASARLDVPLPVDP